MKVRMVISTTLFLLSFRHLSSFIQTESSSLTGLEAFIDKLLSPIS